ncbi:uncharacterized protein LOC116218362 [Clupea harengus]|uniref:Uncharacterized protein LOC116218362 n=1 Tax=Clupea harengus TaxID=7950 RepID=A0A6P8ETL4_CLUHA|nr:uncharacterized protein LOC116218362 [Clupea harengus]
MHMSKVLPVFIFLLMGYSTGSNDEWVDYIDMLRYDSVSQSMKRKDDPCAKCYETHGLWAPIMILKHAPLADLFKIGMTLLLIILGHTFIRALLRRRGNHNPPPLAVPQVQAVGEAHGEHVDPQDPEPGVEEAPQFLQPRVEENDNSSEGHLLGTQIRPAAMGPEFENNLPAHNTQNPLDREGDGTESDSERYCSFHFPVPETRE